MPNWMLRIGCQLQRRHKRQINVFFQSNWNKRKLSKYLWVKENQLVSKHPHFDLKLNWLMSLCIYLNQCMFYALMICEISENISVLSKYGLGSGYILEAIHQQRCNEIWSSILYVIWRTLTISRWIELRGAAPTELKEPQDDFLHDSKLQKGKANLFI